VDEFGKRFQNFSINTTWSYVLIVLAAFGYFFLAYYIPRESFAILITVYFFLFVIYLVLQKSELTLMQLIFAGVLFRALFIIAIPGLSDDFYRFMWDGKLTDNDINPFSITPARLVNDPSLNISGIDQELFIQLNSPDYYTIYPPVCQFVFWVAAFFGGNNILHNVVIMRLFILLAEMGTMVMLTRLFKVLHFNAKYILLYILNPLVIIELTGNLHFEALMIFFVLAGYYFIKQDKYWLAGVGFGLSVGAKLLPLMFMPFFFKRLKARQWLVLFFACGVTIVLVFLPFVGQEFLRGFLSSFRLYFERFEFNASIFYVVRGIGFWQKGYDIIQTAGPVLSYIVFFGIVIMALTHRPERLLLAGLFMLALTLYFSFATIVHPWYITPLVAFCVFSKFRFPILWSFLVFFTYAGYTESGFRENFWIVTIEYLLVWALMIYELYKYWPFGLSVRGGEVRN